MANTIETSVKLNPNPREASSERFGTVGSMKILGVVPTTDRSANENESFETITSNNLTGTNDRFAFGDLSPCMGDSVSILVIIGICDEASCEHDFYTKTLASKSPNQFASVSGCCTRRGLPNTRLVGLS